MQTDTLGALLWVGLIICYAWSVRNLARQSRRPPASDAGTGSTQIVVNTGRRSGRAPAGGAGNPQSISRADQSAWRN